MRKWVRAYIELNRAERWGFVALSVLLLILISVRATLSLWVRADVDRESEAALAEAWAQFRLSAASASENDQRAAEALFYFDPNTLDSTGFRRLGLPEQTTRMLLNWRSKGKKFYRKEDLKPLRNLTEAEYLRLAPFIQIKSTSVGATDNLSDYDPNKPLDLNTADSAALVRLRGIGPVLANKITARRKALGGFVEHTQLLEIYPFKDTIMVALRQRLIIRTEGVKRMNLNTVDIDALSAHPYIGKPLAERIIHLREESGSFKNITELTRVPLMNDEIYRKIVPYLTID